MDDTESGLLIDTFFETKSIKNKEKMMKHTRIFSLLGVVVAAVAVLAALMTSIAVAHTNILAKVHMPLQPIDVDGDGDNTWFLANFHVFEDDMAEGSIQWRDINSQGILQFQNGQVGCAEDRPTLDLLGTLYTGPLSGEPDVIQDVAVKVTPIRYSLPLTITNNLLIDFDPMVYNKLNASGQLALNIDPCE